MPVTINGNGHISGLVVGGLPNGTVDADTLASNSVTTNKIHNAAVTSAKTSGIGGLTMADHWRITNDGTLNTDSTTQLNDSVSCNWERADTNSPGFIGTGMSEDNGVFTFPSTGIYQIIGNLQVGRNSAENRFATLYCQVTTDNNTYTNAAGGSGGFGQNYQRNTCSLCYIFDVTNTSTHKVRFACYTNRSSVLWRGDTTANYSAFVFMKLGDT